MFLSKYLKASKASLTNINGSMVLLLILLQIAFWYPFLSEAHDELERQNRLKVSAETNWKKTQQQANQLRDMRFEDEPWVHHKVEAMKDGVPTQWSVSGSAPLAEWRAVLEKIETQYALSLLAASWQRSHSERWRGHLLFAIESPKANREFHNWLPTKLHMTHFEQEDWQLLSTMRTGDRTSALVTYKDALHWVHEGSWVPDAGVTVNSVSFDQISLIAKDGSEETVVVRERSANDE